MKRYHFGLVVATALAFGSVPLGLARAADPTPEESSEALRKELVRAYFAAPTIHRAYRFTRGTSEAGLEIFRSGARHGVVLEQNGGAQGWIVTDGKILVLSGRAEASGPVENTVASVDRHWADFREAIHALCARWRTEDPSPAAFRVAMNLDVVPSEEPNLTMHIDLAMRWGQAVEPSWLIEGVVVPDATSPAGKPVRATISGNVAHLHREDGLPSDLEGKHPTTGEGWSLRERAPSTTAENWTRKIDELCAQSAQAPEGDAISRAWAPWLLAEAVGNLHGVAAPARDSRSFWLAALRALSECTWQTPRSTADLRSWVHAYQEGVRESDKTRPSSAKKEERKRRLAQEWVRRTWPVASKAILDVCRQRGDTKEWGEGIEARLAYYYGEWVAEQIQIDWED